MWQGINQYQKFWLHAFTFLVSVVIAQVFNNYYFILLPFILLFLSGLLKITVYKTETFFWLLIFFLPLSTEWQVTPFLSLDFPTEPLMIILSFVCILKWLHRPTAFPKELLQSKLFFILILHLFWIGIICFFSTNMFLSFKFLMAKIWFIIPFVILPQLIIKNEADVKRIARLLLLSMTVVCIQSLVRHGFYSFSFEGIKKTLFPFFRNHVNYSGMLVCLLPLVWLGKILHFKDELHLKKNRFIFYLIYFIFITALLLAFSRGAWLALIIGFLAAWLIKKKWLKVAIIGAVLFVTVGLDWLSFNNNYLRFAPNFNKTIYHTNFNEHLQATVSFTDVSNAERFYRWVAGAKMTTIHPIQGFGPNSFYNNYKHYAAEIFKTWVSNNPDHSTVHNYFLLIAIEQGFIGLGLFLMLYFTMLLTSQEVYHNTTNKKHQAIALTIGVVLTMIGVLNFLSDLVETDKIGSLFWICLGLLIWLKTHTSKQSMLP